MLTFVLTVHFLLCAALVGLVLIQQGKGADMGAAFGAGSSNSLFGAGGANNLVVKITTFIAVAFMITSIALINLSNSDSAIASTEVNSTDISGSVMDQVTDVNSVATPVTAAVATNAPQANASETIAPTIAVSSPVPAQTVSAAAEGNKK